MSKQEVEAQNNSQEINMDQKRRKLDQEKKVTERLQCEFIIINKNRRCCMQRKPDQKYCTEHLVHSKESEKGERIPCPLDNKHKVWTKNLASHLKKCNAKPREQHDLWYEKDINGKVEPFFENELDRNSDTHLNEVELYQKYISILKGILEFKPLEFSISEHTSLKKRLSEVSNQKHVVQQSSLIGNMKRRGFLDIDKFYIEYGCGKGELSRFVNLCVLEEIQTDNIGKVNYGYGFIDRGVNRMKVDSKIIKDCQDKSESINPIIKRSRIDIKDLNVDKFLEDVDVSNVVVISKHLCGAATDLTFKLLLNSSLLNRDISKFGGLLIAMCCRHACSYEQLLPESRRYLQEKGFKTLESFNILKKIVSWAVCGTPSGVKAEESNEHTSGLSFKEREEVGLIGRRLIDESRVFALNQALSSRNLTVEMFWYVDKQTTLENVCLCIKPIAEC